MSDSNFTPEDVERARTLAADLEAAMERIGFYMNSYSIRAQLDPLVISGMDPEDPIKTIEEIFKNGGMMYVDASFKLNQVAFTNRVLLNDDEKAVEEMLTNEGLTELDMSVQEALEFDFDVNNEGEEQ